MGENTNADGERVASIESNPRSLQLWWGSLALSIVCYGVVLGVIPVAKDATATALPETARPAVVVMAAASAALSIWYRRRAANLRHSQPTRPEAETSIALPPTSPLTPAQEQVVAWVFVEAIAIYGLLLAFPERDLCTYVPFGLSALILTYYHRPSAWMRPR